MRLLSIVQGPYTVSLLTLGLGVLAALLYFPLRLTYIMWRVGVFSDPMYRQRQPPGIDIVTGINYTWWAPLIVFVLVTCISGRLLQK
jgi:hypothetical protein